MSLLFPVVDEVLGGVPIMGSAAARSLIETYSDINENLDFSEIKKKKNIFALRVNRDSMIDTCVADGVIVLMEKITY